MAETNIPQAASPTSTAETKPTTPTTPESKPTEASSAPEGDKSAAPVKPTTAARKLMDVNAQKAAIARERAEIAAQKTELEQKTAQFAGLDKDAALFQSDPDAFAKKYNLDSDAAFEKWAQQKISSLKKDTPEAKMATRLEALEKKLAEADRKEAERIAAENKAKNDAYTATYRKTLTEAGKNTEKYPFVAALGGQAGDHLWETAVQLDFANRQAAGKKGHESHPHPTPDEVASELNDYIKELVEAAKPKEVVPEPVKKGHTKSISGKKTLTNTSSQSTTKTDKHMSQAERRKAAGDAFRNAGKN